MYTTINEERENMQIPKISLKGMAIATNNMSRMVDFYNTVFNATLTPFMMGSFTLYQGQIDELNITLAPNEMLDIQADKSRYQLSFIVPNLDEAVALARRTGGTQMQEISIYEGDRYCGVTDPDGNSIELVEPLAHLSFYDTNAIPI